MSPLLYQHPLAFLVGLEGVALMRAFAGEHDEAFTRARLAETKALLDDAARWGDGITMPPLSIADGYDAWAPHYDSPDNAIFAVEESVVWPLLGSLPPGDALDVACGTGRHAGRLASLGHEVSGVDASPGMLDVARRNVPGVGFTLGDVHALPVADASVDVVTYALALCHVEEIEPVFAELARILRPGGHLVLSDSRGHFTGSTLYPIVEETLDGRVGYVPTWRHGTGDYVRAALATGFRIVACEEPVREPDRPGAYDPPESVDVTEPPNLWALMPWVPEATTAAYTGATAVIVWHLVRD